MFSAIDNPFVLMPILVQTCDGLWVVQHQMDQSLSMRHPSELFGVDATMRIMEEIRLRRAAMRVTFDLSRNTVELFVQEPHEMWVRDVDWRSERGPYEEV